MNVGNFISGFSVFSKSSLYTWKFSVHVLLQPSLKDFRHCLVNMWNECSCLVVWTFSDRALLCYWDEIDISQSCGYCWVFQICWHIECSTLTTSSFRIWNSSARILSPPVALFIVLLLKANLTSFQDVWALMNDHIIMVIKVIKSFLYSSSMYSYHFFLISSASVISLPFLSFIYAHSHMTFSLDIFNFLEEISSLSDFIVSSISLHCSLKRAFLSLLAILWNFAFSWAYLSLSSLPFASLLFSTICKAPQTTILPSCISFSLGWFLSLTPVQCYKPLSVVLQAPCLSDLTPWIYSFPPLYNHKGFDLYLTWMA